MAWTIPLDGEYVISWLFNAWNDDHTVQHKGLDLATMGIEGLPVVAPTNMTIAYTGFDEGGYGNYVKGSTDDGLTIILAHLKNLPLVGEGDTVKAGDLLGYSGNTGNSSGPHLHFEVREGGVPIDPMPFIEGGTEPPSYPPGGDNEEPGTPLDPVLQPIKDVLNPISEFTTWIKDLNFKKLVGDAVVIVGGLILVGFALYAIVQSQSGQAIGSALGSAINKASGSNEG